MGNCCGSESGNFKGEGRTLSAAPANAPPQSDNQRAAVPPKISAPQGQGRTLGRNPQAPDQSASAKEAAARAAEERAKASQQGKGKLGKLGKQLDAQKSQTQADTLAQNARDNVAQRGADTAAQTRNWD